MDRPSGCERTYTFRLIDAAGRSDADWRRRLWTTHESVNVGGRIFGDWLLTLRGGLCHTLADTAEGRTRVRAADAKAADAKSGDDACARHARRRRVLLALSWLSVESRRNAPLDFAVGTTETGSPCTLTALAEILRKRGLPQAAIEKWVEDCRPALEAEIREDAVWIDRSARFDALVAGQNAETARDDCRQVLWNLFTEQYLVVPLQAEESPAGETSGMSPADQAPVRASSSGAGQRTRHLFSHLFGTSAVFGKQSEKLGLCAFWRAHLTAEIARSGMPLDEAPKRGRKRLDDVNRSPSEFHREMFAKAATRLAQTVTKIRRQEANRLRWLEADQRLQQLEVKFPVALGCFDQYRRINPSQPIGTEALFSCREILLRKANARPLVAQKTLARSAVGGADTTTLLDDDAGDDLVNHPEVIEEFNVFWFTGGNASRENLKAYSEGTTARAGASMLKAVSYRHPDPYFNPIFCQFGVSRPQIDFQRLYGERAGAAPTDYRTVNLLLWDGAQATVQPLRAISKRFDAEIGCADDAATGDAPRLDVVRRTRLGAAASDTATSNVTASRAAGAPSLRVDHVFDGAPIVVRRKAERKTPARAEAKTKAPRWNGALRADRSTLARLGRYAEHDPARAARLIENGLKWWLSVSLELIPHGPWIDYGRQHGLHDTKYEAPSGQSQIVTGLTNKTEQWRGLAFPFWHPSNRATSRKGKAKQLLSALPNLRLLAVVPGQEHGAACAVWQTLSAAQFDRECERIERQGGSVQIQPLWAAAKVNQPAPGRSQAKLATRSVSYRRIGPDTYDDGTPHPACWARLERQFLIKLPGEADDVRRPTREELAAVRQLEMELGVDSEIATIKSSANVNVLIEYALKLVARGMRRHASHARIARALVASSGNGASHEGPPGAGAAELAQALGQWYAMAFSAESPDAWARELWERYIAKLPLDRYAPKSSAVSVGLATAGQRRLTRLQSQQISRQLTVFERVVLRQKWTARWTEDDGQAAAWWPLSALRQADAGASGNDQHGPSIAATGWHARMRWIHDWVRGRKAGEAGRAMGGLSLQRMAVIHSAQELVRAFHCRPHPDRSEEKPSTGVAARTAGMLERKLDDRSKQLASRIVEAALGIGRQPTRGTGGAWTADAPCHAIVLGSLGGTLAGAQGAAPEFSADQRLMFGRSSRLLRSRLIETCQLHGLHLTGFASKHAGRQDARTGAPGIRYSEVERSAFVAEAGPWSAKRADARRRVEAAVQAKRLPALEDLFWLVLENNAHLDNAGLGPASQNAARPGSAPTLRIPNPSGRLFMPLGSDASVLRGVSAELNAAANIGLQPLLDADWPGSWWYVPTIAGRGSNRRPDPARCKGAGCLDQWQVQPLLTGQTAGASAGRTGGQGEPLEFGLRRRLSLALGLPGSDEREPCLAATSGTAPTAEPVQRKRGRPRKVAATNQPSQYMNCWRDVSSDSLSGGAWRDYANYNRFVLARALTRLLQDSPAFSYSPSLGGHVDLR